MGLWAYIKEAFRATYLGMFVSPSWMIIAVFGFLGIVLSPGFFLIGTGLELAYLLTIATNPRFQSYVQNKVRGQLLLQQKRELSKQADKLVKQLNDEEKNRFNNLKSRCDSIIEPYSSQYHLTAQIIDQHTQSLNKLLWIFLQMLVTKHAITRSLQGVVNSKVQADFTQRINALQNQLNDKTVTDGLRKSLESKLEILKLRLQTLSEAKQKLTYIDAELDRIEQQVELIREQAVVSKDSQGIADRIALASSSLNQTGEWIKQQEGFLDSIEDVTEPPPTIVSQKQANKEKQ